MAEQPLPERRKSREVWTFLFLTVVFWPLAAIAVVGGYGLVVWIYQMLAGPPTA
jgi:nitrate reductase NapE